MTIEEEYKKKLAEMNNERKAFLREWESQYYKLIRQVHGEREDYPEKELIEHVHVKVIEGSTIKEAIEDYITEHNKHVDWYDNIKYYPIFGMSKDIVKRNKEKNGYRRLVKEGGLNTRELSNSKHTQEHFNRLDTSQKILQRIESIGDDNLELKKKLAKAESDIELLKQVTGAEHEDESLLVKYLKESGFTNAQIAEHLNISVRKVQYLHRKSKQE